MKGIHAPLLPLAGCLITGIALCDWLDEWKTGIVLLAVAIIPTALLYRWPQWRTAGIWLCFFILGMTLGARSLYTNTYYEEEPSRIERVQQRFLGWRQQLLADFRQWGIQDEAYGVIAAMTLGDKSSLDKGTKENYRQVGASHILALSGLHLMIIYGVISTLVYWRRIRIVSQVLTVLAIWGFALLTGMSPSVTRAAAMISVYALLSLGYREKMSVNTLAFVAIVMLVIHPMSLYDIGFQLSFMAVLAIILLNPIFYGFIPLHIHQQYRWLSWLWGLTTVSLSAQIGTAPLVAYYFGRLPTYFLLTNYIVIPLATVILYLSLLCIAVSFWSFAVGWVATALSAVVILMNNLLAWVATLPHCSIDGIRLSAPQVFFIYVLIGCGYVLLSLRFPATHRSG